MLSGIFGVPYPANSFVVLQKSFHSAQALSIFSGQLLVSLSYCTYFVMTFILPSLEDLDTLSFSSERAINNRNPSKTTQIIGNLSTLIIYKAILPE